MADMSFHHPDMAEGSREFILTGTQGKDDLPRIHYLKNGECPTFALSRYIWARIPQSGLNFQPQKGEYFRCGSGFPAAIRRHADNADRGWEAAPTT